ncbi:hypothetical protein BV378_10430 [Nostoc sp. RF31YmG]|nr:hypothetical protein BV378_10430 [Nostoc sp. RF31YmG]
MLTVSKAKVGVVKTVAAKAKKVVKLEYFWLKNLLFILTPLVFLINVQLVLWLVDKKTDKFLFNK